DWFDFADMRNKYDNPSNSFLYPQALWERKISHFQTAMECGFKTNLLVTPNHVYIDQLHAKLLANTENKRFFGQLLCPSIPEAKEIILNNYRNIFTELRENGIHLDSLSGCPFDYGGCGCPECTPWIIAFGKIFISIADIAKEFFPSIDARLAGWWWTADELTMFNKWADKNHPGRFKSFASHIPYGKTKPETPFTFPVNCDPHAFIHIVYSDAVPPDDRYGPWGPVAAPYRMESTVKDLKKEGYTGFMAYTEGLCDDVNKALLGALSSEMASDSHTVLTTYAERYFGAKGNTAREWAHWLSDWGKSFELSIEKSKAVFERLVIGATDSWRLRQFKAKLELFEMHHKVMALTDWNNERINAAQRFFKAREEFQRNVWGLGIVRHGLNQNYHQPSWYSEWAALKKGKLQKVTEHWTAEA
ncbi:MAG: hypothetical protein JNL74_22020, partial [Fibrobacteres bacterium]|nr:hypothetical protein [Fibrobacterota bacterium]